MCGICGELTFDARPVRAETIIAMRDRLEHRGPDDQGVFVSDDQRVVFGSEIKAIFAHPDVRVEIDESQVAPYFFFGYVPHPATFYRGIMQVDPAGVVVVDADGRTESRRYWQLQFPEAGQERRI